MFCFLHQIRADDFSIQFPTKVEESSLLQKQGLWWRFITPDGGISLFQSVLFNRVTVYPPEKRDVWVFGHVLCFQIICPKWQIIPGVYLPSWSNLLYPKPKGFLWCSACLNAKPLLSFVPGCLCTAQARGQGRQDVGGSAWSAGTSWIERRLAKCRLCLEQQSSAVLAHRAGRGWTSRCCTSSPQSAHGKHTLPTAFPAED